MNTIIITNGDFALDLPQSQNVTHYGTSIVRILENIDGATVLVGEDKGEGTFSEFHNGDITSAGAPVNHGKGSKLMVRVSGLGANPLLISVKEHS